MCSDEQSDDAALSGAARRAVIRQGLSVALSTGLYGASFGALSVNNGFSVPQTCALSRPWCARRARTNSGTVGAAGDHGSGAPQLVQRHQDRLRTARGRHGGFQRSLAD